MSDPLNGPPPVEAPKAEPYQSFADLKDAHTELLKLETHMTDRSAFLDRVEEFCNRAHVTGALLGHHPDRRATQSMLNYWVATLFSGDRSPEQTILKDYDSSQIVKIKDEDCPYPGSRAFREDEARNFFGRKTTTEYISNRLKVDRLLVLIGPSGRGKTSLLLAGILPALQFEDECASRKRFYFPLLIPGSDPLASFEGMIKSSATGSAQPLQTPFRNFTRNPKYLLELIKQVTDLPAVILIDQFEDVFNLSHDRKVQHAFIANLLAVAQNSETSHTVILAMRNDSYDEEIKRLPKAFQDQIEPAKWPVPPLGGGEIGDAIKKPAEKVGLKFPESTLLSLIKEILAEPIGLPLLQFALRKLWSKRNDVNEIPDHILTVGGCRAAFISTADQLYQELKPDERQTMRLILLQMVSFDEETVMDVPVRRTDLYKAGKREQVDYVLKRLSEEGLVRFTENPVPEDVQVEMTHNSLVRGWTEMALLVAARKSTRRFLKYGVILIAAFFILFLVFLGAREFIEGRRQKRTFLAHRLARQSDTLLGKNRYDVALLLSSHAFKLDDNAVSRDSVLNTLSMNPLPFKFLAKPHYEAADLAFSLDKKKLATLDASGNISIWEIDNKPTEERILTSSSNAGFPLAFSADGKTLASRAMLPSEDDELIPDPESNIRLWDVSTGTVKNLFVDTAYWPSVMTFSPNGNMLITSGTDGRVLKWDLTKEKPDWVELLKLEESAQALAVNPQGTLACGTVDSGTLLWDAGNWSRHRTLGKSPRRRPQQSEPAADEQVFALSFSKDGKTLAVDRPTKTVVWDMMTETELRTTSSPEEDTGLLSAFSEDGQTLISYSGDGNVFFLNLADGGRSQLRKPFELASFLALSADGSMLALPSEHGVTLWNLAEGRPLNIAETLPPITSLAFDPVPNSMTLAAGLNEGQVILWNSATRQKLGELQPPSKNAASMLAFSPDGKTLAEGLVLGTLLLWNLPQGSLISEIKIAGLQFKDLVFSADGKRIAAVVFNGQTQTNQLVLRDLESGSEQKLENFDNVTSVAFGNDSTTLFVGNDAGKIFAWDTTNQKVLQEAGFGQEDSPILSLRLDPSGKLLAVGTRRAVTVWDVADLSTVSAHFFTTRWGGFQFGFATAGDSLGILKPPPRESLGREQGRVQTREGGWVLLAMMNGNGQTDASVTEVHNYSIPGVGELPILAMRSDGKLVALANNARAIDLWNTNLDSAKQFCAIANGNLSQEDWNTFIGGERTYCRICPEFKSGEGAEPDASECSYSGWKSWW